MAKKEIQHVNLKEIKSPDFLKKMSYEELDVLSADIRDYILDITSTHGGHVSSNLGTVEAIISLCRSFDFTKDRIIFDVGHQAYTYKILTGRSLENFRKKGGTSGFQKMSESPYDHFECGHSSTSISVANGMAIARDLNHENYNIIAFIGDSSITNGLALEGINNLAASQHKVIIVLNDNNMSISKPVGALARSFRKFSTSKLYVGGKRKTKNLLDKSRPGRRLLRHFTNFKNWFKRKVINITPFDNIGFSVIGPIDGHYIKHLDKSFAKAKRLDKSVVIHIKTMKGKGYPYAENDEQGDWHGLSSFDKETGNIKKKENAYSWSYIYSSLLEKEMENNDKIVTIVAATGHGSDLDPLFKKYPNRMVDVGIAEEHALTLAGGLALTHHPVISIYSTFLQRAYDELSHDIARMNLNATILIDRAGLVGADGDTHQGIYDEAFLYSIPNVTITMASDNAIASSLLNESLKQHGVFAIRYPREHVYHLDDNKVDIPYGGWIKEKEGKDVALVTTGPVVNELKELAKDKQVCLYNAVYVRPILDKYVDELMKFKKVIIYNPYATKEGFARALEGMLLEKGYKGEVILKTVPTAFVKHATIEEQREEFGISVKDILKIL